MGKSSTWLIKRCAEFEPRNNLPLVPRAIRGIYVLFRRRGVSYNVVYVGMASGGVRGRLEAHARSAKGPLWTHFSVFEVHDNITPAMIAELEGLFRHVYRRDSRANPLNIQGTHRPLRRVKAQLEKWQEWRDWQWYWG